MATKNGGQKLRVGNPNLTKTGKTRLGSLNINQLETLLEKTSRGITKSKIINRIRILKLRKGFVDAVKEVSVEEAAVVESLL